jgi:hypothetical protein
MRIFIKRAMLTCLLVMGMTAMSQAASTFTFTPTDSPTITASPTDTPTITPSVTDSPTITPSVTDSPTITPSVTDSPTITPSATDSPTITPSATDSPTITPSATDSPTQTVTPVVTSTATPTATLTPDPLLTCSATITVSPTATIYLTFTQTSTATEVLNALVAVNHNYFNPMTGQTLDIRNLNTRHAEITIRVYTQRGHLIKELLHNRSVSRDTIISWDGRNNSGQVVASGVYVIMVKGKKLNKRFRVAVIK